jgi:hypothetical protein
VFFRRLDRGPKRRAERPSLHDKPLIVEGRSLVYGGFARMCERAAATNNRPSPDLSPQVSKARSL